MPHTARQRGPLRTLTIVLRSALNIINIIALMVMVESFKYRVDGNHPEVTLHVSQHFLAAPELRQKGGRA